MLINQTNNPVFAFKCFLTGLKLITHKQLRGFLVIPIVINIILYSSAFVLGYHYINQLIQRFIPDWLMWLDWLLWPLFFLGFMVVGFFSFTLLANLFAAPFYGCLAAKTLLVMGEESGQIRVEPPLVKTILAECKRIIYLVKLALPLLLLFLIPGINLLAPVLWLVFGAWAIALEYFAYPLENAGLLFVEQKSMIKTMRLGALSFGGLAMAGLSLPVLNLVIAPAAVIGATLYTARIDHIDNG